MDKETLSNYGWVVICILVLSVMIALATPFGKYVSSAVKSTATGLNDTSDKALSVVGLNGKGEWNDTDNQDTTDDVKRNEVMPENAVYYKGGILCPDCQGEYGVKEVEHGRVQYCENEFTNNTTKTYTPSQGFPEITEVGDIYVEGDYKYSYFADGWHVTVFDDKPSYEGRLLSEINGKKLTSMYNTFYGCETLLAAPIIPSTVVDMEGTFAGCEQMTTVPKIPDGVTNMKDTFESCYSITVAPKIPNGVTNMEATFYHCSSLTVAPSIPNGVTTMAYAFQGCTSLTSAPAIPSSVKNIEKTFCECSSLTGSVEINCDPDEYYKCLNGSQITEVTGSTTLKAKILATK